MYVEDFWKRFSDFHDEAEEIGSFRGLFQVVGSSLGNHIDIDLDGVVTPITSFMNLNYLNLGTDPFVVEFARKNISTFGTGFASSRSAMDSAIHNEFERKLADWKGGKACLLVNTGYLAGVVVTSLLLDDIAVAGGHTLRHQKAVVFVDEYTHACVLDALTTLKHKLSHLEVRKYKHLNYDILARKT